MVGLNSIGSVAGTAVQSLTQPRSTVAAPFSGMMQSIVAQTDDLDRKAAAAVSGLMSGQGVEVHEAMIATQKSDMAFELALQVRNKAVGAYQQMMNMQF